VSHEEEEEEDMCHDINIHETVFTDVNYKKKRNSEKAGNKCSVMQLAVVRSVELIIPVTYDNVLSSN
jgi:uncharacterized OsmC-like protein